MLYDNASQLVDTSIALLVISSVTIVLRCYVRLRLRSFGLDDWLMCLGMALFILMCATTIIGAHSGFGAHFANVADFTKGDKLWFLWQVAYLSASIPIKLSILWTLRRIATRRVYIYAIDTVSVILTIWALVTIFYVIGYCTPTAFHWDKSIAGGKCNKEETTKAFAYAYSAIEIVTDWFCAILPIFLLWNVQMNIKRKASVAFVLSLGAFASTATIVRLQSLIYISNPDDFLFGIANVIIWSVIECGIGISAGSIATLRPIFHALLSGSIIGSSQPLSSHGARVGQSYFASASDHPGRDLQSLEPNESLELEEGKRNASEVKTHISSNSGLSGSRSSDDVFGDDQSQRGIVCSGITVQKDVDIRTSATL